MTDQAIRVVPAGWYEDPASPAHVRWWNGLAWTEHTAIKPTAGPQPMASSYGDYGDGFGTRRYGDGFASEASDAAAASTSADSTHADSIQAGSTQTGSTQTGSTQTPETLARIAEARDLERQFGISTGENDILRSVQGGSTTAAHADSDYRPWNAEPEPEYEEPGTSTASSWFIALWPLFTLVAAATAAYLAFYVMPEPAVAGIPVVAAIALVPSLLTLIWAAVDARRLRDNGFRPASAGLALLGPLIYLIGRRARVKGSGPLVTLILLTLLAVGGPVAAYQTGSAVSVTKAIEIQQAVQGDLVGDGTLASVTCPVFIVDFDRGSLYTCEGVTPAGESRLVWVSIDTESGDFSYALAVR